MYCACVCNECGREKRFKTFGFNSIVTRGLGMNGGIVNYELDWCASELGFLAGCCYRGNEPAVSTSGALWPAK